MRQSLFHVDLDTIVRSLRTLDFEARRLGSCISYTNVQKNSLFALPRISSVIFIVKRGLII